MDKIQITKNSKNEEVIKNGDKEFAFTETLLTNDFSVKKVNITTDKILDKTEQDTIEKCLKNDGRKLIHEYLKPCKNDYVNDYDKGTVEYHPKCKNYSFHRVVIPDGTTLENCNFTQKIPHTISIQGKNLNFIMCNLINVELDPTWTVVGCNKCQIKKIEKSVEDVNIDGQVMKKIIISNQVEKAGAYIEIGLIEKIVDVEQYNLLKARWNK